MSSKKYINFDINKFLSYYKDTTNPDIQIDPTQLVTHFYIKNSKNKYIEVSNPLSQRFITINEEKLYITNYIDKYKVEHILFTIPTEINGILWDFHYHFGLKKNYISQRSTRTSDNRIGAIFFHKTIQDPINKERTSIDCHFHRKIDLTNVSRIKCVSHPTNRMSDEFPITSEDYMYIEEILRRPFIGIKRGGRIRKSVKKRKSRNFTSKNKRRH